MGEKGFWDNTIVILLVTIFSYSALGFYEAGYCSYFRIPQEYISIELTRYGVHLFSFLSVFTLIALVVDGTLGHFKAVKEVNNKYVRIIAWSVLIAILIFCFRDVFLHINSSILLTFSLSIVLGTSLILNKRKVDSDYNLIDPKRSILIFLSRISHQIVGLIIVTSSIICFIAFYLGFYSAMNQKEFFSKPDGKSFLLRKYSDNVIYGIYEAGKFSSIIIERKTEGADTLKAFKLVGK